MRTIPERVIRVATTDLAEIWDNTHTQTFNIQQIPKPLMITSVMINSGYRGNYSTNLVPPPPHPITILQGQCLTCG